MGQQKCPPTPATKASNTSKNREEAELVGLVGEHGQGQFRLPGITGCWYEGLPIPGPTAWVTLGPLETLEKSQPSEVTKSTLSTDRRKRYARQCALVSKRQPIPRDEQDPHLPQRPQKKLRHLVTFSACPTTQRYPDFSDLPHQNQTAQSFKEHSSSKIKEVISSS